MLAYIHDFDIETLNTRLLTKTPPEVVATFPYLSDLEKTFACMACCHESSCLLFASSDALNKPLSVNGGVKTGQWGGVKPGQFAAGA